MRFFLSRKYLKLGLLDYRVGVCFTLEKTNETPPQYL